MNAQQLAELRGELPRVDIGYVIKNYPQHLKLAERYNAKRAAVDPDDPSTHEPARAALRKLVATGIR